MLRYPGVVPLVFAVALLAILPVASNGAAGSSVGHAPESSTSGCSSDTTLCLSEGRFLLDATWTKPDGTSGVAHAVAVTPDSGYFWFFDQENIELVIKTLNGCSVNDHYWVFAGGLTNLAVTVTVTDTTTNRTKTYTNFQGTPFQPITDTTAFESCPAGLAAAGNPEEPREDLLLSTPTAARRDASIGCVPGDTLLCLNGRFQVEASWLSPSGRTGPAHAVALTPESGYLWFFDADNVEIVVKSLDACGLSRGNWLFGAGMTTVGVDLKVTDTFTGEVRTYSNSLGTAFRPIQDTAAFSFCATPTKTPTPTPTPTPPSAETPRSTPTPMPTRTPAAQVSISYDNFSPSIVHIHAGDVVEWVWPGDRPPYEQHSTTSGSCCGSSCVADGAWDSGLRSAPFRFSRRFPQGGTFTYFDNFLRPPCGHPFCIPWHSRGTVVVDPPAGTPTVTPTPTPTPLPSGTVLVGKQTCFFLPRDVFVPWSINIHVGDAVTWIWTADSHSTTSGACDNNSNCVPDGNWDSGVQGSGFTFTRVFTQVGTFPYFCRVPQDGGFHERGSVTVYP